MNAAVSEISSTFPDLWARTILPGVSTAPVDTFLFTKETTVPSGLIPWREGEELIDSSRATLVAGAKANREPMRYFGNRFGRFATRYLDHVLMGQTAVGSYVVTALVPVNARIPISSSGGNSFEYENVDIAIGRAITESVVQGLESTTEALERYRKTASLDGFEAGVSSGVSYELVTAVQAIASNSGGAEIAVQWESDPSGPVAPAMAVFEFKPTDASVLERAATTLASPSETVLHVAQGRVHLLTKKEADGPGVVGVDDGKYKFRVRLRSEDQYHDAVLAHDEDREVEVIGELAREGNINWIYDAVLRRVPNPADSQKVDERLFDDED